MSTTDRLESLARRHADLTEELATALRELGDLRAGAIRAHSDTWRATEHLPVTERRETCREATSTIDAEAARLTGDIDAFRVEIAHLEHAQRAVIHAYPQS